MDGTMPDGMADPSDDPNIRSAESGSLPRLLFDHALDAILLTEPGGGVLDANPAACEMLRGDVATLCALGREGLVDTSDPRLEPLLTERAATGFASGRLRMRRADGETFEAEANSRVFVTESGERRTVMIVRELTEIQRLEGLEHGYRTLFMTAYDAIAVFGLDGTILDINAAGAELLGRSRDEIVGAHFQDFIAAESREELQRSFEARLAGDSAGRRYETRLLARDGSAIPVEVTSAALSAGDRVAGITCVLRDLREREQQEQLEEQLRHAEKLKSLGVLAGGIAHDFNNLLLTVLGHASIAQSLVPPDSEAARSLAAIETGARRAAELAEQMLAYAGRSEVAVQSVDVDELVREIAELLRASVPHRIELRLRLDEDLPAVTGDPAQLRQVLLNLVTNAADAIGENAGAITVTTRTQHVGDSDDRTCVLGETIEPGEYVQVAVEDTGSGMDEEVQARIFEPFFTTKETGRGLGLAATAGVVRSHRGGLTLRSAPGAGSTFSVLLPAHEVRVEPAGGGPAPAEAGEGVVLVIDDEELVRTTVCRMLEYFGYTALSAASGREGAALAAREPAIDAVALDLTMPGASGLEVLESLRRIRPDLPVVLMSGYSEAARPVAANVSFIQKPFTADEFVRLLQTTISTVSGDAE